MSTNHHIQRIAVVRGGMSDEYDVSMQTGGGVLQSLRKSPYIIDDIIITKGGEWLYEGKVRQPEQLLATTDVVFIALHGAYGEDGQLQRVLERLNIAYTGSRSMPSAVAMNKLLTKQRVESLGVKLAPHHKVTRASERELISIVSAIASKFGPEYVIKPISGGSSFGTQIANSASTLLRALESALSQYEEVLVEKRIRGREATCGVVERFRQQSVYNLPAIEIVPPSEQDFFTTDAKYSGQSQEICPARFSKAEKQQLETAARDVHAALGLSQYSRSDFIVGKDGIYFLEVNTLPGLTQESLFPKALSAVGSTYDEFILHLVHDAIDSKMQR